MPIANSRSRFLYFALLFIAVSVIFSALGISPHVAEAFRLFPSSKETQDIPSVTVVIDAGHGGEDGGACTYGGLPEKDLNLFIAKDLELMLRLCGINVIMTRNDDRLLYDPKSDYEGHKKSMDLAARLKIANETPNAILISIHMNAFPESKYSGLQVYYSDQSIDSLNLAQMIQNTCKSRLMPSNARKVKAAGSNIYLLHRFTGVGILVECGFLSNEAEREKLNTSEYRHQLAACFLEAIIEYISSYNY